MCVLDSMSSAGGSAIDTDSYEHTTNAGPFVVLHCLLKENHFGFGFTVSKQSHTHWPGFTTMYQLQTS